MAAACDLSLLSSSTAHGIEEAIEDVDVDDQELDSADEAESSPTTVLTSGRIFLVDRVTRSTGGHRPHFLFEGRLCDIVQGSGAGYELQQVMTSKDLSLSLRYEPPSPKFSRSCPDMSSYRLKLLQGSQFIYLLRGLPRVLILDQPARAVGWGVLQLVFSTSQQLDSFLAVLRHVSIVPDQLWPREIAQLWRPVMSEGGSDPRLQGPAQELVASADPGSGGPQAGWTLHSQGPSSSQSEIQPSCWPAATRQHAGAEVQGVYSGGELWAEDGEEKVQAEEGSWRGWWQGWREWAGANPEVVGGMVVAAAAAAACAVVLMRAQHR